MSLARAERPLSAAEIASQFRQGRRVERDIALSLRAFARLGDLSTAGRWQDLRAAKVGVTGSARGCRSPLREMADGGRLAQRRLPTRRLPLAIELPARRALNGRMP
jgi:hypothetical protein